MFSTYILQSQKTGRYYIGSSNNLQRRLKEHNANKTKSIKNKGPYQLVYKEEYATLIEARRRELQIKAYKGGNAFKQLLLSL